eukprot:7158746-Lingulodinium_polyedra.AAC.1
MAAFCGRQPGLGEGPPFRRPRAGRCLNIGRPPGWSGLRRQAPNFGPRQQSLVVRGRGAGTATPVGAW